MSVINGKVLKDAWGNVITDDIDDPGLNGTPEVDYIDGLGGDDYLWGGFGDDHLFGGDGDDHIYPYDMNVAIVNDWGFDEAYGEGGDDYLDFMKTTHAVYLSGGDDSDFIRGGSADGDIIYGDAGIDYIWGMGGVDYISGGTETDNIYAGDGNDIVTGDGGTDWVFGDGGHDTLFGAEGDDLVAGGYGNDQIDGGPGQDELWGGPNADKFVFKAWDSDPSTPDNITDFQAKSSSWYVVGPYDKIDLDGPAGTLSNYSEFLIGYDEPRSPILPPRGYAEARDFAEDHIGGGTRYVFVTDEVDGYLFSDANGDGTIENGIVLEGLTNLSHFSFENII